MEARDARESRAFAAVPGTHRHPAAPRRTKGKAMNYVDGFVCAVPTANRENTAGMQRLPLRFSKRTAL
jgi:hypothetical protein